MSLVAGVVISTHENPRALDLEFRAWARQRVAPARIVVPDDGSGPETAAVGARRRAVHVRLAHGGSFGKCRVVTAGVGGFWIRYTAPACHLWHERPRVDEEAQVRHRRMLEETRRNRATRSEYGIR